LIDPALQELRLPRSEMLTALMSFNLVVERLALY
jgi:hypothetical protein